MSDPRSGTGADDAARLDAAELDTYFALMEAVSLLQHSVEQQLRAEGTSATCNSSSWPASPPPAGS